MDILIFVIGMVGIILIIIGGVQLIRYRNNQDKMKKAFVSLGLGVTLFVVQRIISSMI